LRSPDDLRDAFHELRAEEQRGVPPFRASGLSSVGGRGRPPLHRRYTFAVATLLLLLIGAAMLIRRQPPARHSLPQSISTWKAPTDFLLQTPESKLLRTVPAFGLPKKGTSS
jgi:hypothetical protein